MGTKRYRGKSLSLTSRRKDFCETKTKNSRDKDTQTIESKKKKEDLDGKKTNNDITNFTFFPLINQLSALP